MPCDCRRWMIRRIATLCVVAVSVSGEAAWADDASDADVSQLVERVKQSVVVVTFTGRDGKQQGLGSGFVVDADGLIVTNLHVLGEARPIQVRTFSGDVFPVVNVHATDRTHDLAVLKVDAQELPVSNWATRIRSSRDSRSFPSGIRSDSNTRSCRDRLGTP